MRKEDVESQVRDDRLMVDLEQLAPVLEKLNVSDVHFRVDCSEQIYDFTVVDPDACTEEVYSCVNKGKVWRFYKRVASAKSVDSKARLTLAEDVYERGLSPEGL